VPLTWAAAAAAILALVGAIAIFVSGHRTPESRETYPAIRGQVAEAVAPVSGALAAPVRWTGSGVDYVRGYFFAVSENRKLRAQVAELERLRNLASALKSTNQRYEALLKLRTEPPIPSVGARVISDSRGPFANARLADAGSEKGVRVGNPVMNERGVVGRVVNVSARVSRILLLTDAESRTPVLINRTDARAILTGDGGPNPRLDYLRGQAPIKAGDQIFTSGDGGVYPRGLPVGVAVRDPRGVWRVQLYADDASIDFVRLLNFEDIGALADQAALSQTHPPPLTPAEAAEVRAQAEARAVPRLVIPTPPPAAQPGAPPAPAAGTPATAAPAPAATTAVPARPAPAAAPTSATRPAAATPVSPRPPAPTPRPAATPAAPAVPAQP
jgi:rod shape-determining protein MreC